MSLDDVPDLTNASRELRAIYEKYPSTSGRCDLCATQTGETIHRIYPNYEVDIVRLQNEMGPGGTRGAVMRAYDKKDELFEIAQDPRNMQPFHEVVRIQTDNAIYVIDALISERIGIHPMLLQDYFGLWEYPDGIEITGIRNLP